MNLTLFAATTDAQVLRSMPPTCGVYLLARNDEIIYVGSSVAVLSRLGDHKQQANSGIRLCPDSCDGYHDWDSAAILYCRTLSEARSIEKCLIYLFNPVCNKQRKEPSELDIATYAKRVPFGWDEARCQTT